MLHKHGPAQLNQAEHKHQKQGQHQRGFNDRRAESRAASPVRKTAHHRTIAVL
jgi:hypothetical protein